MPRIKWRRCKGWCLSANDDILNTCDPHYLTILFSITLSVFFLVSFHCQKKKSRIVSLLYCVCPVFVAGVHVLVGLNCDKMKPMHEEQHSQYPVERNPSAYRSMRDYKHPPWVSAPFYTVPPTNAPYGSTYNPGWGNQPNFSWK